MTVQFILGRSGTGKSSCCLEQIADALRDGGSDDRLILLVPEQGTYQAERAILADKGIKGYARLNVVSFERLSFLVSSGQGAGPVLSSTAKAMIVHRILRDNKNELKILGGSANRFGLGMKMAQVISELHRCDNGPEDVERMAEQLLQNSDLLRGMKFADISLVMREYLKFIDGRFVDTDVQFNQARRRIAEFSAGAKLWVDGFSSFSGSELAMLTELLKSAADSKIALCLDAAKIDLQKPIADMSTMFGTTEQTYAEILDRVGKCKLKLAKPIVLKEAKRFADNKALRHVEQDIFELDSDKASAAENIKIVAAANGRAEVQYVARQIRRLVKQSGYRYRDIAVVTSDIDYYQPFIQAYFADYRIPFFIDKRRPIEQHPVVEMICSALAAVDGQFATSDVMACVKSGMAGLDSAQIGLLENYTLAFGVDGNDWQSGKDFRYQPKGEEYFDEEQINQFRKKIIVPLVELQKAICPSDQKDKKINAEEFTRAVFSFLGKLDVKRQLENRIEEAENLGDAESADEHRQFYAKLVGAFDELCDVFGDQNMSGSDHIAIITAAFSQMTLGLIPPGLDQVLVGSIDRSRHPNLKAVFLMGTTQGQFPSTISDGTLLTDSDRQAAVAVNFALAGGSEQRLAERQYLAYIAFTRASEFLCVTYPAVDDKSKAVVRSQFVTSLEELFDDLVEETAAVGQADIYMLTSESDLEDMLCGRLGKDTNLAAGDEPFEELLEDICADERFGDMGARVKEAISYDNVAELDSQIAGEFFGDRLNSSATRLGTFAACPYKYFTRYVLGLEERKEFKFRPLDIGNFYHQVLDAIIKKLIKDKKDLAALTESQLLTILKEQISNVVQKDSFVSSFVQRSRHNLFIFKSICDHLENCVLAIRYMAAAGQFRPKGSEISFGYEETETIFKLPDGKEVCLRGKIDRFDVAEIAGEKVGVVFDYKRKSMSFSWRKFYHGLDLQLPVYMLAAGGQIKDVSRVVGAFYMPVESSDAGYKAKGIFDGEFFAQLDSGAEKGWSEFYNFSISKDAGQYGNYNSSGALKKNDFQRVLSFAREKIIELCQGIISGRIDVQPFRMGSECACANCIYQPLCRFDWQINEFNILPAVDKKDVLGVIKNDG